MATWEECNQPIEKIIPPKSVLEITENGKYDVLGKSGVDVNVSGGGSSDFSIAEVTFINTNPNDYYIVAALPHLIGENMTLEPFNVANSPVTVSVPAYKNGFYYPGVFFDNVDPTVMPVETGGLSFDFEMSALVVSGDGTFTAAGMPGQ